MKYFTSDLHLQHEHILGFTKRPYSSLADHDKEVLELINSRVGREDELFLLGDIAWYNFDKSWLRCKRTHLIWGNHDRQKIGRQFTTDNDVLEVKSTDGLQTFFLSHYPHAFWPGSHRGHMHLYGHMHDMAEGMLDQLFPGRRAMEVGLDSALRIFGKCIPFSEYEVRDILGSRPGHDLRDLRPAEEIRLAI